MTNLMSLIRRLGAVAVLAALTACASPSKPYDYTAFKEAKPASLLVLPPVNDTPDVNATYGVLSNLSMPLGEAGYYVLPVSLVDETLRTNGITTPADAHQIDAAKLRQIFGADAALYVDVKQYGSVYKVLSSETIVEMHAKLVDLRTGALLWDGKATASSAEQSSTQSNPIAMLVQAVVDQIAANLTDRSYQIAGMTSNRLVYAPNGLLPGPRARQPVKN
ncbi:hypothetical protein SAMN05428960_3264 [Mitsuaria sp. PDC51]|uniref:DUF799 domain-containing protein n=1 Tax=unclassified Roseateles TaxID=2626991 RepID=UPI0008F02E10|nr:MULTISPECIES: DUF799 domain-containing protein [unclassified Roseateles]MBB3283479.1 hypothetical protein [Mitsuaria sp. BK037]SFR92398.1 hypothetical protein SAMN05428960_3264 [Mitsuaria sp. PDC51]